LVDDAKTGKTCIVNKFTQNRFTDDYRPTISPSYDTQQIIINDDKTHKKYIIELQLYDTKGTLPSNIAIPISINELLSNQSSLKSKKHPKSSKNTERDRDRDNANITNILWKQFEIQKHG